MNIEKFKEYAEDQDIKWCKIFSPQGPLIANYSEDSTKEFISRIEKFANNFGGKWTIHCKKSATSPDNVICKVQVIFGEEAAANIAAPMLGGTQNFKLDDLKKIKDEIREDVRAEYKKKEQEKVLKDRIDELESENKDLKSIGGKFSYALQGFVEKIMSKNSLAPKLAGTGTEPGNTSDEVTREKIKQAFPNLNDEQVNLKYAVDTMMSYMDLNTFIGLAEAVKKDPSLVEKVKLFLNI